MPIELEQLCTHLTAPPQRMSIRQRRCKQTYHQGRVKIINFLQLSAPPPSIDKPDQT
jgi:hypothetical protein